MNNIKLPSDLQDEEELEVFRRFAESSDLPIKMQSIQKCKPPEPDILCEIEDVGFVAFELVRLIPSEHAHRVGLRQATIDEIKKYRTKLPSAEQNKFKELFNGTLIHFRFKDLVPLSQRTKLLSSAFSHLLSLPKGFIGVTYKNRKSNLREISIGHVGWNHISFDTDALGFVSEPTEIAVSNKCSKKYVSKHPIELLAHFFDSDVLPDEIWYPILKEYTEKDDFDLGCFRRIWFFAEHGRKIKYVFPKFSHETICEPDSESH